MSKGTKDGQKVTAPTWLTHCLLLLSLLLGDAAGRPAHTHTIFSPLVLEYYSSEATTSRREGTEANVVEIARGFCFPHLRSSAGAMAASLFPAHCPSASVFILQRLRRGGRCRMERCRAGGRARADLSVSLSLSLCPSPFSALT